MENTDIKPRTTPRDFFLQLAVTIALYVSTVSFLSFIFDVINYALPDRQYDYYDPYSSSMRWAISVILVVFPLFLLLSRMVVQTLTTNPEKKNLSFRKWLVYLTLFLTGVAIAVDLIVLLNTFLGGEITTRFMLKVLAIFVVTSGIFGYYLSELRDTYKLPALRKRYAIGSSIVVLLSLIAGFMLIGSPMTQRLKRDDLQRVNDLNTLQSEIITYWQYKQKLPTTMSDLKDPLTNYSLPTDPATKAPYEYTKTGENAFTLCATFSFATQPGQGNTMFAEGNENWVHQKGRACFDRTIDPQRYRPISSEKTPSININE